MRGMMKWQPFKSLDGQYRVLREHQRERKKVEKPELSLDEIEQIDRTLTSLSKGDRVDVRYYQDGFIREEKETFLKADPISRSIHLSSGTLRFEDLLSLKKEGEEENFDGC